MKVILSMNTSNKRYHKDGCFYANRIRYSNRMEIEDTQAIKHGYRKCAYCGCLRGDIKTRDSQIKGWENKYKLKLTYDKDHNTLFIDTHGGLWKVVETPDGKYILYHANSYQEGISHKDVSKRDYHRQNDVKETGSLSKIVSYVAAHDKAKPIIANDYRVLPQKTKKQKKYYAKAKRRSRKASIARVESIFDELEKSNPDIKDSSVW